MKVSIFELKLLEELVGEEQLWSIIEAHQGTRLYIPKTPAPCLETQRLAGIVGDEVYKMLCEELGGDYLYFPMAMIKKKRNKRIYTLYYDQSLTMREIARRLHVSEACVQAVLRSGD